MIEPVSTRSGLWFTICASPPLEPSNDKCLELPPASNTVHTCLSHPSCVLCAKGRSSEYEIRQEFLSMPTRAAVAIKSKASLLREVLDSSGRYDAAKIARYLDWDQSDIARYLGKDRSAVSVRPTAVSFQDRLAQLAAVI